MSNLLVVTPLYEKSGIGHPMFKYNREIQYRKMHGKKMPLT